MNYSIDIDDIYYNMDDQEKQEMIDLLYSDGYNPSSPEGILQDEIDSASWTDTQWNTAVLKLINRKWQLSKEDEQTILKIASQLP